MKRSHAGWLAPLLLIVAAAGILPARADSPLVIRVDIDRIVHPLTVEIVANALKQAEDEGAAAVVIRLNTPGGLLSATQQIIQKIIASKVPVITYVAPSGGRAASAGFMILVAGDIAAMAPGTNTGAAHPVLLGGEMDEIMKQKVENDAAAAVRSVTAKRGRNPELAEKAVLESKAFTEKEALEAGLIDWIASDLPELLRLVSGKPVTRFDGQVQTLLVADARIVPYQLTYRESVLSALIDPNLAFVLLVLGLVGIYVEFTNPGLIVPGVAGAILVTVGAMALTLLPINWAGAALILIGLTCFVLEATMTSGGILGAGGAVAMVLGAVMLVDTGIPELTISWITAIAVTLPFAAITMFLMQLAVRSFRHKVSTGREGMRDEIGIAKTDVHHEGRVFVHGELWNAKSEQPIALGAAVRVLEVEGLTLSVDEADGAGAAVPE